MSVIRSSTANKSNSMQNTRFPFLVERVSKAVKYTRIAAIVSFLSILSIYSSGCSSKFFEPRQIGRFRPVPAVNVILDTLGVAEEAPSAWKGAEEPKPIDVIPYKTDYTFVAGDTVTVYIFELLQTGVAFQNDYMVSETGKISIPEVGIIEAAGLTESQLEEEIRQILSPNILKEPSVVVSLLISQQRTYSIWGDGIDEPGRYRIPRYDFRLADAIATAGGMRQFNVSYTYVSRAFTGEEIAAESIDAETAKPVEEELIEPEEMLEIIAPLAQKQRSTSSQGLIITSTEMITDKELAELALPREGELAGVERTPEGTGNVPESRSAGREAIEEPINEDGTSRIEWVFRDGRWVPMRSGVPETTEREVVVEPLRERIPEQFNWDEVGTGGVQSRVIKIPADKLRAGDPRYNILVRPGDNIHVPVDVTGEFFIYGNTNFQGAVHMQGRPMTLKMAIAAAGGLGPLAWPKKCEVTRRIGENKEETVMVDLDKIASGEQPDFFIKPLDLINVGTHPTAIWRAVLRSSFRATYGFGFIYDRNFLDRDFLIKSGPPTYNPITPWKWDTWEEESLF